MKAINVRERDFGGLEVAFGAVDVGAHEKADHESGCDLCARAPARELVRVAVRAEDVREEDRGRIECTEPAAERHERHAERHMREGTPCTKPEGLTHATLPQK